ncbi:MAG: serine/threonine protein phosphatase [Rhizobium sp.]|nr:serine/threonine protein phosphatase [Rhizobium sp.]
MLKFIKGLMGAKPAPVQLRARISIPQERVADIFAIGDIHGHLDLLLAAEQRIFERMRQSKRPALVVCVGDYVDRGPDSKGVIGHLCRKLPRPFYRICVCGNHDDAFLTFLKEDRFDPAWLEFGGEKTLMSYGVDAAHLLSIDPTGRQLKQVARDHVPVEHVDFLVQLPVALSVGDYLFVHAGVLPGRPLAEQSDFDLMWMREPFLTQGSGLAVTIIHGHTPGTNFQFGPNRIGIDTGAYMTGKLGVLHIGPDGIEEI